jgi:hypothetical protein
MEATKTHNKNPRRVAAGKLNRAKRGQLTAGGVARLRLAIQRHQPWRFSTGPKTAAGKAQAARNGRRRQPVSQSLRQARVRLAAVRKDLVDFEMLLGNGFLSRSVKIIAK